MSARADVLVVGGGAVGCAAAWFLAREGASVRLLERDDVAAHASGAAAGMLLPWGESRGAGPFLALAERSLAMFPELCAELREACGIDPEFEPSGALHVAFSEADAAAGRERARAFTGRDLEWLDAEAARDALPGLAAGILGAVWAPREAHVRSPLLAKAFAASAARLGAVVERGVAAIRLRREGDRVTGVESSAGWRGAGTVVVCAGAWSPALSPVALPIEPVRGQVVSVDQTHPPLRAIAVGPGAYLVPKRDGRIVVGATEERVGFDCRVTAAGVASLLVAGIEILPALADSAFRDAWAGLRPTTPDGLPVLGPAPGTHGLLLAAGHGRNGVLLAPITGRLVADLVVGKPLTTEAAVLRAERFFEGDGQMRSKRRGRRRPWYTARTSMKSSRTV